MKRAKKSSTAQAVGRSGPSDCSTQEPQLFTTEEYQRIVCGACFAKPQTEAQILAVIRHAERLRIDSLILESVMDGIVSMYADKDCKIMFIRSNPGHQGTTHLVRRTLDGVVQPSESDLKK